MKLAKISIALLFLLASCASDVANRYYGSATYEPKDPANVEILWRAPQRAYAVIADFQSRRETPEDMQDKAAAIGADAVIVSLLGGQYRLSDQWASADTMHNSYSHITGTAIIYK